MPRPGWASRPSLSLKSLLSILPPSTSPAALAAELRSSNLPATCQQQGHCRLFFSISQGYRDLVTSSGKSLQRQAHLSPTLRGQILGRWRQPWVATVVPAAVNARAHVLLSRASSGLASSQVLEPLQAGVGRRRWGGARVVAGVVLLPAALATAAWVALGDDPWMRAKVLWLVPVRLARDAATAAAIVQDYRSSLAGLEIGSPEREAAKHEAHNRCAARLQQLCFKNGGIYIKLAQHIGQLDYLVPEEYVRTMRTVMLDRCPISSFQEVTEVFMNELGKPPKEVFAEFECKPLASASLAQVHRARLHSGEVVAVKVQHAHLTDTAAADIATVSLVIWAVFKLFPEYDFRWLMEEVQESLPQELNFVHEALNNERCVRNFAERSPALAKRLAVPHVRWDLSTRRILTMEYMEGVGVTDVTRIQEMGLRPKDVARLVSEVFADMIFRQGFVHCDPHAANMLVRPDAAKPSQPQLVLLDHGLYRTLDDSIRENYAGLWKALVFADGEEVRKRSVALGAGEDLHRLFAAALTQRPWDAIVDPSVDHLAVKAEDRSELQGYATQYYKEITELLRRLPRVILLLLKTNDCLRSVDYALGTPVNTYMIVGRESTRALSEMHLSREGGGSLVARAKAALEVYSVNIWVHSAEVAAWLFPLLHWVGQRFGRLLGRHEVHDMKGTAIQGTRALAGASMPR